MTRSLMAMLVVAGGLTPAMFGQQYPQQYPQQQYPQQQYPQRQGDPGGQYDNGQYPAYDGDQAYDQSVQGDYAPAPPPMPSYAYQRPPMPGPGYYWVDGFWNFMGGRYSWTAGYWMLPPYAGGYWVAPRYSSGRFFRGYWSAPRRGYDRGFVRGGYGYRGSQPSQQHYRAPASRGSDFRSDRSRDFRPSTRGQRDGRR